MRGADLCEKISLKTMPKANIRTNQRLSLAALRFLYAYHKWGPVCGTGARAMPENANLLRHLETLKGVDFYPHSEWLEQYCLQQESAIAWIEARVGSGLRADVPRNNKEPAILSERDLLAFAAESLDWLAAHSGTLPGCLAQEKPVAVAAALYRLCCRAFGGEARGRWRFVPGHIEARVWQRAQARLALARRKSPRGTIA